MKNIKFKQNELQSLTTSQLATKAGMTIKEVNKFGYDRDDLIAMITEGNYEDGGDIENENIYFEDNSYIEPIRSLYKYAKGGSVTIEGKKAKYKVKYSLDGGKEKEGYIVPIMTESGHAIDIYYLYDKSKKLVKELRVAEANQLVKDKKISLVKTYDVPMERLETDKNKSVKDMDYSERRNWIQDHIIPHLKSASLSWRDYQGGWFDYNDPKEKEKFLKEARESADYGSEKEFEQKTDFKIDEDGWSIETKEGEELEEVSSDNTYNWSYLGLITWNIRIYRADEEKYFLVAHPHSGGDVRGNYGEPIIFEGDSEESVMYDFREKVIDGNRVVTLEFKGGITLTFDAEQDSDVDYFRLNDTGEKLKIGSPAELTLSTFETFGSWHGDEFLTTIVDEFEREHPKKKKKEYGGDMMADGGDIKSLQSLTTSQLATKAGMTMKEVHQFDYDRDDLIAMITEGNYAKGGGLKKGKINFFDLEDRIENIQYDQDPTDLRLHSEESFRWGAKTEKEYKAAEKEIDSISYKGKGWEIYAWYDVSGFDYWMKRQEETNYIQITIRFNKDTVDESEVEKIDKALDSALADADAIQHKYDYDPYYDKDEDEMKRGGGIRKKNWIKGALSGGKNKGALRRTAMRKGLLRSEKENLSKTDLHKLEKMGGRTAKRAYLAETLRKFDNGGGVDDSKPEHYRYLTIEKVKDGLKLSLTEEGLEEVKELKENERSDLDIWYELFEDVQGNSEFIFHNDMGDSGFGLTSAEGITDGFYYNGERGEMYKTDYPESAKVYWFPNYMILSSLDEMIEKGSVVFDEAKEMKRGGGVNLSKEIKDRIDNVLHHYVTAALWSSSNPDNEDEEFLDENYSIDDIDEKLLKSMRSDIGKFIDENYDAIEKSGMTDEQLGHDLWLTRNGHGAGFWDRGYEKEISDKLTNYAHTMKGTDLYVGGDGKIYAMGSYAKGGLLKQKREQYHDRDVEKYGRRDNTVRARPVGYRYRKIRKNGRLRPVTKDDKEYYGNVSMKDIRLYEKGDKDARRRIYTEFRRDHSDKRPFGKGH